MNGLTIESFQKSDLIALRVYIKEGFHEKYILNDPLYLDWQFDNLLLAKTGTAIVGHLGYKDVAFKIYNQTHSVRVLMNLYALERYRIFGIGALLMQVALKTDKSILISGYTPATQGLCHHFRSSWQDAGNLSRYLLVLNKTAPIISDYDKTTIEIPAVTNQTTKQSFRMVKQRPDDVSLNDLWRKAREQYGVTIERTADYLAWRFFNHPFFNYSVLAAHQDNQLVGYLIFHVEEVTGFSIARIVDMVALVGADKMLLQAFVAEAKEKKWAAADFFFSGAVHEEALRAVGFFNILGTNWDNFPSRFNPLSYRKTFINIGYDFKAPLTDSYFTKADGDQDRPNPH